MRGKALSTTAMQKKGETVQCCQIMKMFSDNLSKTDCIFSGTVYNNDMVILFYAVAVKAAVCRGSEWRISGAGGFKLFPMAAVSLRRKWL